MLTSDQNGSKPLSGAEKKLRNLKKFGPGFDPRRNLKGRPKSFDQLREVAQEIAHRDIKGKNGQSITIAEAVLLKLASADDAPSLRTFLEFSFGKVPDKLDMTTEHKTKLFLNYAHESDRGSDSSDRTARLPSGTN